MYQQCYKKLILLTKCGFILYHFFCNSELHETVSCVCVSPYLRKHCIHTNTALGIPKIILIVFFWLYISTYRFQNCMMFLLWYYLCQSCVCKTKAFEGWIAMWTLFHTYLIFANCKNHLWRICLYLSVSDVICRCDLFPQSVGLIHVVLMSFRNLFHRSQCFTFWSSHDTLCFSF